jgi:molybdate transport system ATP-binding protein
LLRVDLAAAAQQIELDIQLDLPAGRCLALAGPSGAGKTTLLRCIAGTARARGRVVCGEELWLDSERRVFARPEQRSCGFVFQDYALFPHLSAWRNVAYGLHELPRGARRARALELLERFGMTHRADARPETLSGGERQRVALARALARRPQVLLLDEPLSALDARTRASATETLEQVLREFAAPTLLVTHNFQEASRLGDEVAIIEHGTIIQRGPATQLAQAPASDFVAHFTAEAIASGRAGRQPPI